MKKRILHCAVTVDTTLLMTVLLMNGYILIYLRLGLGDTVYQCVALYIDLFLNVI